MASLSSQNSGPVSVTRNANEVRIRIHGDFTFKIRKEFREAYYSYPANTRYVVDMTEVSVMDSSAMGMLMTLRDHAGGDKSDVSLVNLSPRVSSLLKISGLQDMF